LLVWWGWWVGWGGVGWWWGGHVGMAGRRWPVGCGLGDHRGLWWGLRRVSRVST
jgi:hypothetical protein